MVGESARRGEGRAYAGIASRNGLGGRTDPRRSARCGCAHLSGTGERAIPRHDDKGDDLKKVLNKLRSSEPTLRQIIHKIPTLAWCNLPDGSSEFLNQRWHDYTGLSPQEAHGGRWKVAIHSEDLPRLTAKWGTLSDLEPGEYEVRLRRSDGVFRWFLFRIEPLRDEVRVV